MKQFKKRYWGAITCSALLFGTFQSCKKEVLQQENNTKPSISREITGAEAEGILDDIINFYEYTLDVQTTPNTPPVNLPSDIDPERANAMIENVFNYYFARLDYTLARDTPTIVVTEGIEVDVNGEISTLEVAEAFNEIRDEISSFYATQHGLNETSKFVLADAEFKISGGKAVFTVKGFVAQDVGPEPDGDGNYPPFDNTDKWSIYNAGGRSDGYKNGQWGSPEVLTMAVSQDIYPGAQPLKVNITDFAAGGPGWTPSTTPASAGAPDNPMYLIDATMWDNSLMHLVRRANPSNMPTSPPWYSHTDEAWVIPSAMDYYRTWIKDQVIAYCAQNNKSVVKIKIFTNSILGSVLTYYPVFHVLSEFLAGDDMPNVAVPTTPVNL